jgi:hypothetical protein
MKSGMKVDIKHAYEFWGGFYALFYVVSDNFS